MYLFDDFIFNFKCCYFVLFMFVIEFLFILDKNGGGSYGYEFRKFVYRMVLDDVIMVDKIDIGYVDIDWDII